MLGGVNSELLVERVVPKMHHVVPTRVVVMVALVVVVVTAVAVKVAMVMEMILVRVAGV